MNKETKPRKPRAKVLLEGKCLYFKWRILDDGRVQTGNEGYGWAKTWVGGTTFEKDIWPAVVKALAEKVQP